ncbi:MAG: type II secretion system protein GspH [Gammaproteobacteria bacterium]|nr:MAG: type II secretion system protein GspH [Gammaproteobacteria bacterium]
MVSRRVKEQTGDTQQGFTLIEILVVLVLVGIIASVSVLTIGSNHQSKELVNEIKRLHALMQLIADEAVLNNEEYGFAIDSDGYEFLIYNDAGKSWLATSDNLFKSRRLPEWLTVSVEQETDFATLKTNQEEATKVPQIVFFSSGEITPFRLFFAMQAGSSTQFGIESDGFNGINLKLPGMDDDV